MGAAHAVATANCTTALHLALLAAGVGPDDEVIVSPHSFIASANAILHCGAKPVFVDIRADTLNMDEQAVESAVTPRTKAILAIHQIGRPAELTTLTEAARRHHLTLIEDAACAIGSEYRGRPIGCNDWSPLVCFSFHPRKVLSTGDGGMITTQGAHHRHGEIPHSRLQLPPDGRAGFHRPGPAPPPRCAPCAPPHDRRAL
jgi:dTDP-4-amino-4,6-dideoxygalactose transaminase